MNAPACQVFFDKWLAMEPWHRLLLVFEPPARRVSRMLLECIGFELRQAALTRSDARVSGAKLDWWLREWERAESGEPQHPLTRALPSVPGGVAAAGQHWVHAAARLADEESPPGLPDLLARWRHFADRQAQLSAAWLPDCVQAPDLHAFALAGEQLPRAAAELAHGRLPLPLSLLARLGLTRARLREDATVATTALAAHAGELLAAQPQARDEHDGYRRRQVVLARLRLSEAQRRPARVWAGDVRLPPLRAALAVWRAR